MNPVEAVTSVFKNYVNFTGVARRSEFWWYNLFIFLVGLVVSLLDLAIFGPNENRFWSNGPLSTILSLGVLLPGLAVSVRRLRDAGYGWYNLFWVFLPFVGGIILIVLWCQPSKYAHNNAWNNQGQYWNGGYNAAEAPQQPYQGQYPQQPYQYPQPPVAGPYNANGYGVPPEQQGNLGGPDLKK